MIPVPQFGLAFEFPLAGDLALVGKYAMKVRLEPLSWLCRASALLSPPQSFTVVNNKVYRSPRLRARSDGLGVFSFGAFFIANVSAMFAFEVMI